MASTWNPHCASCIGALLFPTATLWGSAHATCIHGPWYGYCVHTRVLKSGVSKQHCMTMLSDCSLCSRVLLLGTHQPCWWAMNTDVIFGYHFYSPHNFVLLNQTRWLDLTCWRLIRVASETLVLTSRVSCHVGSWPVNSCAMTADCCSTEVFNLSRWCLLINTARTSISKRPVTQFKKEDLLTYLPMVIQLHRRAKLQKLQIVIKYLLPRSMLVTLDTINDISDFLSNNTYFSDT